MSIKVIRTSSAVAKRAVENSYFESILETSDEWIASRTGILNRYFAEDEKTSDLSLRAVRALDPSDSEIRLVLHASFSPDLIVPCIAAKIQKETGLSEDCFCADVNMGCTGFVGALMMAERYLKEGERGIVIGSEKISDHLNFEDRTTAVLFGDGAGAVLVEKTSSGKFAMKMKTYGNDEDLYMPRGEKVSMQGKNVYRFAVDKVPAVIREVLDDAGVSTEEVDHVICHQANVRILDQIEKRTGIAKEKFHVNLDRFGNTSAASVPLLWHELAEKGVLKRGEKLLVTAFGAGLSVGTILMEW